MKTLQEFASVHVNVHNHFNSARHLIDRPTHKALRSAALAKWRGLMALGSTSKIRFRNSAIGAH
jgi:putative transposase